MRSEFFLGLMLIVPSIFNSKAFAMDNDEFFKNLKGCFSVSFEYIEDGKKDQFIDGLYEWVGSLAGDPETSIQHIGVVENQAFKHWREEWHPNADGSWYQKVTGPAGDFRYECSAPIQFNQWRCSVRNAPKPRRDKARNDYETLDRENTLQVTSRDWIQAENNIKRDQSGKAISNELGWNKYHRVDESKCQAAKDLIARNPHL